MAKKRILCFPPSISSAWPSPKNLSPVPLSALFLAPLVRLISFFRSPSSSPSYNVLSPLLLEGNIYIFFMAQSLWKIPPPHPPSFLSSGVKTNPAVPQHCSKQTFTEGDISYQRLADSLHRRATRSLPIRPTRLRLAGSSILSPLTPPASRPPETF